LYEELAEKFEEQLLTVATRFASTFNELILPSTIETDVPLPEELAATGSVAITSARNYSLMIAITSEEIERWNQGYLKDEYFRAVLKKLKENDVRAAVLQ
jgi:hypothetical protein